jgi:gamma-carbonic anhydrase
MTLIVHHKSHPSVHSSAFVAESACLIGDVEIGKDASIWFNAVVRGDINAVKIGDRTNIQDGCVLHVTHQSPVRVGADVTVGHGAIVHGCAAGSVVLENFEVPEGMLAAGVPARIIRALTDDERLAIIQSAQHYVEYSRSYRQ